MRGVDFLSDGDDCNGDDCDNDDHDKKDNDEDGNLDMTIMQHYHPLQLG